MNNELGFDYNHETEWMTESWRQKAQRLDSEKIKDATPGEFSEKYNATLDLHQHFKQERTGASGNAGTANNGMPRVG
jgi:hypothetical protein